MATSWRPGGPAIRNRRDALLLGLLPGAATPHAVPRPHRFIVLATSGWAAARRAPGMGRAQADPLEHVHMKILTNHPCRSVRSGRGGNRHRRHRTRRRARARRTHERVGPCGRVRVRRQLAHQHRQRLLRRPAVHALATWHGYGGVGNPADASKSTQIAIAEKVLAGQGWGAWPVCSIKAGATGSSSSAGSSSGACRTARPARRPRLARVVEHVGLASSGSRTSCPRPLGARCRWRTPRCAAAPRPAAVKTVGQDLHGPVRRLPRRRSRRSSASTAGWQRLWAANPKVGDPDLIYVGQKLQLPA